MWISTFLLSNEGFLFFIFLVLLMAYNLKKRNPRNFPPGPFALPIVGNLQLINKKHPHIYFTKLAEIYGNVFSFCFGSNKIVFVSGYKLVKEALVTQADNFVDRPYSAMADRFYSGISDGLFQSNGETWKAQRRFALSTLRNFGLGKNRMEQCICEEIRYLVMCSADLFLAGTETTATTLMWALVFLIRHPDIQEKVQAEIDSVIGQTRQPSMADRPNLPYTDAVIHEVQRMGNIVPLNGFRVAANDTTLDGYHIPKGTTLITMLTSVLFDKNEWETPNTFNPGHFLDADGKFVKREAFLPFSAGKRVCLGESLAKMELFLFFVSLLQKFSFSVPDGVELSAEGITGFIRVPEPFKVYAKAC